MYKLKRENIEQEVPITINSDECKLNFERVDGKTEQDGEPTPETPIEIKNVEGKNILDKVNNLFQGGFDTSNGGNDNINNDSHRCCTKKINIKNMNNIIFSGSSYFEIMAFYQSDGTFISYSQNSSTAVPQNAEYVRIRFRDANNDLDVSTLKELDLMLEEGFVATPYVPYNSIAFKVENKNLLAYTLEKLKTRNTSGTWNNNVYSWNGVDFTINEDGTINVNGTASTVAYLFLENHLRLVNGTDYILHGTPSGGAVTGYSLRIYTGTSYVSDIGAGRTFTYSEQDKIRLNVAQGTVANNILFKPMIEKGSTKTEYVTHAEQTKPFTFEDGQYLAEGGYLADDGIHNIYKQIDLSTLSWTKRNTNEQGISTYSSAISDRKIANNLTPLCTHFSYLGIVIGYTQMYTKGLGIAFYYNSSNPSANAIYLNSTQSTVAHLLTELNEIILQYELAEESITTYTETQQTQWKAIKSLKSYNGVTHVTVDATLNPKIYFSYNPQLTEEIKLAVSKNPEKAYIEVLEDGTILNESNYLQSVSLSDERYLDKQGIFGTVIAKELTGKFVNVDSSFNIENKEIKYYNGPVMSDNSVNYFDYGTYIVQKPENDNVKDNTSFTALDYMVKFNKKFEDRLDYDDTENPVTIGILLQDICDQCEVKLATKTFRNSDYVLENNQFVGGETCREVLSAIAQIAFSWARINEDDELALDFNITDEITEELDNDDYFSLEFNNKYGPINTIVLSNSQIEGENYTRQDVDLVEQPIGKNKLNINARSYIVYPLQTCAVATIEDSKMIITKDTTVNRPCIYVIKLILEPNTSYIVTGTAQKTEDNSTGACNLGIKTNTLSSTGWFQGAYTSITSSETNIELSFSSGSYTNLFIYFEVDKANNTNSRTVEYNNLMIRKSDTSADYEVAIPRGEIILEIQDNPFAYTQAKRQSLSYAGRDLFGFEYIPMKIKTAGKNYLNCLDKIKIKNMQDEYYETYIFNNKLDFKGITLDEKETPAMTDVQVKYEYKGEVSQAIKRTEIIVDKQNGTIESITKNVQNLETSEHNDYQEIIQKFDGYAPKSQVVTLENSVTQLQTDTYTKTEINTKLIDGSVTKVQTISGTFDENGMTYEKTNAETKSTINETGINVKKASDDETILFAGYVDENNSQYADYKGQTIVATENILVKKYLVVGSHTRFEDYETGTGCFYLE